MKKKNYIAVLASFVLVSILLANWFSTGKKESTSILQDRAASLSSLLPPENVSADIAAPVAQNVPSATRSPQMGSPSPTVAVSPQEQAPAQKPTATPAPVSFIYVYTGVPVRPAPISYIVYAGGGVPPTGGQTNAVPVPVSQPFAIPVFVPQVVPSRVGPPKWVYSNGVVIKPKVYFPNQPVRNTVRYAVP